MKRPFTIIDDRPCSPARILYEPLSSTGPLCSLVCSLCAIGRTGSIVPRANLVLNRADSLTSPCASAIKTRIRLVCITTTTDRNTFKIVVEGSLYN